MIGKRVSRRQMVAGSAAASAAMLAAPFVRTANAAGSLSVGMWDHWVPGASSAMEKLIREWAEKEKVEVTVDFITSQGNKLLLTTAAQGQAKSGHDILYLQSWLTSRYHEMLEPVDDIMADLIKNNGDVSSVAKYLAQINGTWRAVPNIYGAQMKGPSSRIDLLKQHAGIDVQAIYPAGGAPKSDGWTYDVMLKAAEACHKAGVPIGIGLGTTNDSVDTVGAVFAAFGAILVDEKAKITVKTDNVREVLDYFKRLVPWLPDSAPSWDDASNNKLFVAGKTAMIMNPPSAWAVALRDAPQIAEQTWHHPMPKGPKGRYASFSQGALGIWSFAKNKSAAKSLLRYLATKEFGRGDGEIQQGLRHPTLRQLQDVCHLGRDRAAEGHALPLSRSARGSDPRRRGDAEPAWRRGANLHAGPDDQDGRAPRAGRGDGEDAGLGGERDRRFPALRRVGIRCTGKGCTARRSPASSCSKRAHGAVTCAPGPCD